jgi:hypothetical protein
VTHPDDKPERVDRRSFLERAGAAAVLPLVALPSLRARAQAEGSSSADGMGDEYLVLGLTGLARACEQPGWFQAHWGAAVLAACYLCREHDLDDRLVGAIRTQVDAMIEKRASYFRPLEPQQADAALVEQVARALEQPISGLRSHGHAATFAALALRALDDAPEMATPSVIEGLCRISQRIGRNKPLADHAYNREHPLPAYTGERSIAEAVYDCILRYEGVRYLPADAGGARRPNFTHEITYSDALIQLHRMGYAELAHRGHAPHGIYVNTVPPPSLPRDRPMHPFARLDVVLSAEFWEYEPNVRGWSADFDATSARMGDWVVGHQFKLLYSLARMRPLVADPEKARRVERVVLERFVEPTTAGG